MNSAALGNLAAVLVAGVRGLDCDYPAARNGFEAIAINLEDRLDRIADALERRRKTASAA